MHAWEAVQKSVDYIEEHLQENIRAEALAEIIGLSPFYFQRLFKRLVNKPLQEYVKLRRLAKAVEGRLWNYTGSIQKESSFSQHFCKTRSFYGLCYGG